VFRLFRLVTTREYSRRTRIRRRVRDGPAGGRLAGQRADRTNGSSAKQLREAPSDAASRVSSQTGIYPFAGQRRGKRRSVRARPYRAGVLASADFTFSELSTNVNAVAHSRHPWVSGSAGCDALPTERGEGPTVSVYLKRCLMYADFCGAHAGKACHQHQRRESGTDV